MQAFVAMPFNPAFYPVWEAIQRACEKNDITACRVDQLPLIDDIQQTIFQEIERSDLVIVDFSGDKLLTVPNPNVVTEAKHAKDRQKPLLILTQSVEGLPFDWRAHRAVVYENNSPGLVFLSKILTENLAGIKQRIARYPGSEKPFVGGEIQTTSKERQVVRLSKDKSFKVFNDSVIHDTKTGLDWLVGPDKDTTWDAARDWVDSLTVAGGNWRMPTVEELRGLYQNGIGSRNIDPVFQTTGWWVWSGELIGKDVKSSSDGNSPSARGFRFGHGDDHWYVRDRGYCRAFAVRSGRRG